MPELNGIEFLKALRNTDYGQRIYVILLTARDDEKYLVEAFESGADDYLVKPIVDKVLEARLFAARRLLRLRQEIDREHEENRQNLAQLAVANRRLEEAALTDVLTKLPNRRYAIRRLRQVWSSANRADSSVACMLIDIDHFKSINDTFGHIQGDHALCAVATVLRSAAPSNDEVCRIGGEEFLVICEDTYLEAAGSAAERLRFAVEKYQGRIKDSEISLTVSIGVAVGMARDTDTETLMKVADSAVYLAKDSGRNRVCFGPESPPKASLIASA